MSERNPGGPVDPAPVYQVSDPGPEWYAPPVMGSEILPYQGQSGTLTINIHITGFVGDFAQLRQVITDHIAQQLRTRGARS